MLYGAAMGAWRKFARKQSVACRHVAWGLESISKAYFNTYSVLPVETRILAMEPVCPIVSGRESIGGL